VRGANGVILITTKQGKLGKPKVNVTSNWAMLQPSVLPDLLNSYDYAVLHNEADVNSGKTPRFSDEDLRLYKSGEDPIFHPNKDWIDELIKPFSFQQNYNINISGGTEKTRYFTSLTYFNQSGGYHAPETSFGFPYKHNYDRYNIRMNFDFDLSEDFTLSVKLGSQLSDNTYPNGGAYGAFDKATNSSPMSSPGYVDGKYISEVKGLPAGVTHYNPWAQAGSTSTGGAFVTDNFINTLNTNIGMKYKLDKITKGLSIRAMGAYDSYYSKLATRNKAFPTYTVMRDPGDPTKTIIYQNGDSGPYSGPTEGIANNDNAKWRKMYGEVAIDYARTFNDIYRFTGLVLANAQKMYDPSLQYKLPTGYLGVVSRITYDYKSRYLAEFNMGYNGSENFPEGKRFGFFPAFSLGWVVTEESFLPMNNTLSFLKIRGSYGEVGNDKIGGDRYLYLQNALQLGTGGYQQAVFGTSGVDMTRYNMYKEGKLGNPNVTWERSKKWNIGAEIRFFDDKLSFVADYFQEKRGNILINLSSVPELVAATLPAANIGKVDNHGFEIETSFRSEVGEVKYWVKGNYSFARNKVVYKDEASPAYEWMKRTGQPVDQYFGLTFEGFYNTWEEINDPARPTGWNNVALQPGDMKYKDLNGDGLIDAEDISPVGYSNWPEITYGLSVGASWKGFDFSVLFQGVDNVSAYFAAKAALPFTNEWGPAYAWNMERWTPERYANGDPISFPRLTLSPEGHNYQPSNFWIQDGSYLRLKNAEIGYRFTPGLLKKAGISSMRVYVSGNNLQTWTKMKYKVDPDARDTWARVYPPLRVLNAGVNFQF
jgi:TonB-linked SusC/RagA family outer membrane protein